MTFFNAFIYDEEYTSEFTVYMTFTNPRDNFPRNKFEVEDRKSYSFKFRSITFDLPELQSSADVPANIKAKTSELLAADSYNGALPVPFKDKDKLKNWALEVLKVGASMDDRD